MNSYDQWKTASPHDEDQPSCPALEAKCDGKILVGYGKAGHGMNGKDADLDRVGQFRLKSLHVIDPVGSDTMFVVMTCQLGATICPLGFDQLDDFEPSKSLTKYLKGKGEFNDEGIAEYLQDQSEAVVMGTDLPGEWSGDDWYFSQETELRVPISLDEYEEINDGNEETLSLVCDRISTEIYDANKGGNPGREIVKHFEEEVSLMHEMLDSILSEKDREPTAFQSLIRWFKSKLKRR